MAGDKAVITCALTGVLTDPKQMQVPVTPQEMAQAAREARDAGASMVHLHFRDQRPGKGALPTWDPDVAEEICKAVKEAAPDLLINMSTGTIGPDFSGPLACLRRVRPNTAALNAGSLNYLKAKRDGTWAWPPTLFENPVDKIAAHLEVMEECGTVPECECFDTGILRSLTMFQQVGLLKGKFSISLVMGVASGMPAKASWLPLLLEEMPPDVPWQSIAIGRQEIWDLHRSASELGGNLRTGVEDTLYLPNGEHTFSNGKLVEALVALARETGREPATPDEARTLLF